MLQPMLPFLRPKFSSNFKKKERKKGRKKERKKYLWGRPTDRPTDGQTDRRTHMDYFTLYHFVGTQSCRRQFPCLLPPSLPSRIIAGRRCCDNTPPYVRSNMLPSVGGARWRPATPVALFNPSGATILLLDVRTSSNRSSVFFYFEESK